MEKLTVISTIILFALSIYAQQFPLIGSGKSILFAKGRNGRCYPSAAPLQPNNVGLVEFNKSGEVIYRWANCNHHDYASTSELIADINQQFKKRYNKIGKKADLYKIGNSVYIVKTMRKDTLWSIDNALVNSPTKYYKLVRSGGGEEEVFEGPSGRTKLIKNPLRSRIKPIGYGIRKRTSKDINIYDVEYEDERSGKKVYVESLKEGPDNFLDNSEKQVINETPFMNYCDSKDCYEWIPGEQVYAEENAYWQIHFAPEICYYPRNPSTSEPIIADELKMSYETAINKRKESLKTPNDQSLQRYRNPFYSDSASTVISIAIVNETDISNIDEINLSSSEVGSDMMLEHFPPRAYIVNNGDWNEIEKCLLKLYGSDDSEREMLETINTRCPGWKVKDEINGKIIFPAKNRKNGEYEKDESIRDDIFTYNHCPCNVEKALNNLTPVQARKYLRLPTPTCSLFDMMKAGGFYARAKKYLTKTEDKELINKRISRLKSIIALKINELEELNIKIDSEKKQKGCPASWTDEFPDSWRKVDLP